MNGWLAPSGDFVECEHLKHDITARQIFGMDEEILEQKGYIKIFNAWGETSYFARKHPTAEQYEFIECNHIAEL